MRLIALTIAAVLLGSAVPDAHAASTALSKEQSAALLAPVKKLAEAINTARADVPSDVFTADAIVADDFAPFRWDGPGAAKVWYAGLVGGTPEDHTSFVAMHAQVTPGKPQFARVQDDTAYFVLPSVFLFTESGKRVRQTGQWIITEKLVGGHWLVSSHAWAITGEKEVAGH